MRRRIKTKLIYICIFLIFLLCVTFICCFVLFFMIKSEKNSNKNFSEETEEELSTKFEDIRSQLENMTHERDLLSMRIIELEQEKDDIISLYGTSSENFEKMNNELTELRNEVAKRDEAIKKFEMDIRNLGNIYTIDINLQFDILKQLNDMLGNPPPIQKEVEIVKKDGTIERVLQNETPRLALYYEDIFNGYKYAYNADEAFDSASLIKEPFVLSLLMMATEEYENTKDLQGGTQLRYDFNKIFKYTEEFYHSGSGQIIKDAEGKEYTYLELIKYLLLYSDNVAYDVLKNEYGIDDFRKMIYQLGASSMYKTLSRMSAADGGKILKATYEFLSSKSPYAQLMYDSMVNSAHNVMISYGVSPKKTAHKYGWDEGAYHDMGIVYDENPYVIVLLSNLDEGGKEINEYIQSVVKLVTQFHSNFYAKK